MKHDDLALAVCAFGGNNKVIYDDMEKPSIMVGIPKMHYETIMTEGTKEVLPWWIVDGVEKNVIWVSKYLNVVVNDRAYSLPLKDPKTYISFDEAVSVCRNKGNGWHLNQNGVFAAINLWCQRNNFMPRGNSDSGENFDCKHEKGLPCDGGRTATGSGPAAWNHDGTPAGIADLCGNCYEWVSGLRIVNGEIQIIPYGNATKNNCSMLENSTEWKAIKPDGTLVEPGTEGVLHYDNISGKIVINNTTSSPVMGNIPFQNIVANTNVNIPRIAIAAGIIKSNSDNYESEKHYHSINTDGERIPFRGGSNKEKISCGIAMLSMYNQRTFKNNRVSFRAAYVEL